MKTNGNNNTVVVLVQYIARALQLSVMKQAVVESLWPAARYQSSLTKGSCFCHWLRLRLSFQASDNIMEMLPTETEADAFFVTEKETFCGTTNTFFLLLLLNLPGFIYINCNFIIVTVVIFIQTQLKQNRTQEAILGLSFHCSSNH